MCIKSVVEENFKTDLKEWFTQVTWHLISHYNGNVVTKLDSDNWIYLIHRLADTSKSICLNRTKCTIVNMLLGTNNKQFTPMLGFQKHMNLTWTNQKYYMRIYLVKILTDPLNMTKVIWDFLTPRTFCHCSTERPCLVLLCPKTFLVGQVPLSPALSHGSELTVQKAWKPGSTHDHPLQAALGIFPPRWDLVMLKLSEWRPGLQWTGTEPAVRAISGPGISFNKSTEATVRAQSLSYAFIGKVMRC